MPDSAVLHRLRDVLSKQRLDEELSPGVREVLEAFVVACRADGDPPERVLLSLKAIIAEARAGIPPAERRLQADTEQTFKERLVSLCVECYYRTESKPPSA